MNNFFNKIYLINMESRPDRYESTLDMFAKVGVVDFEIVRPLPLESFNGSGSKLQASMQSCKEAHHRIYRDAIQNEYERIMIFEDDCVFNQDDTSIESDISYHIGRCLDFLQNNDWDMFYLDNIFVAKKRNMKMYEFVRLVTQNEIQRFKGKPFSHSYALTVSAAQSLLDYSLQNDHNIDKDMRLWDSNKKYFYTRGIFDQKLGDLTDNVWNTTNG